jgi:phospho-N-acetylmuramoyl-pentapeptide-transferase
VTPFLAAGGIAAALTLAGGGPVIGWLRGVGAVQAIRADAPARHGEKAGTPTMGGVLIIGATVLAALGVGLAALGAPPDLLIALGVIVVFAAIGGADDAIGIARGRNLGLRAREKLLLQIPAPLLLGAYAVAHPHLGSALVVPGTHLSVTLGWAYPLFAMLLVVGMANAVNLTDGLDGLAAGSVAIAALALGVLAARAGAAPVGVLCAAVAGAALGFLWFNAHPAGVFMGDVGSQALGAALAVAAILAKMELAALIVGGVFVAEAVSVILQVTSFKTTGRRLFRMSPVHHHCELLGWTETQTVVRFWVCGALLAAIGMGLGA